MNVLISVQSYNNKWTINDLQKYYQNEYFTAFKTLKFCRGNEILLLMKLRTTCMKLHSNVAYLVQNKHKIKYHQVGFRQNFIYFEEYRHIFNMNYLLLLQLSTLQQLKF